MRYFVYFLVILLGILHHDFWFWNEIEPLIFGFVPIGLAYHAFYSIMAGCVWALAVVYAWPRTIEDDFEELEKIQNT